MFHTLPAVQDVIIHTSDYNGTLYMGWLIHHIITITKHFFSNSLVFVNTPNINNFDILHFFNLIPTVENDVALLSKFKMCFHLAFMICFWPITNIFCKKIEKIGLMQLYQYFDISFFFSNPFKILSQSYNIFLTSFLYAFTQFLLYYIVSFKKIEKKLPPIT